MGQVPDPVGAAGYGRAASYLRRSQNMSMISSSDCTHRSREKSSNYSRTKRDFKQGCQAPKNNRGALGPAATQQSDEREPGQGCPSAGSRPPRAAESEGATAAGLRPHF